MAQEILVKYRAEVDQLTNELKKVVAAQDAITKEQKEGQAAVDKNLSAQEVAARKRAQLIENEKAQLQKLKELRKLAFNPQDIAAYDKKIQEATRNIQTLGGKTKESLGGLSGSIKSIGLGIAASLGAAFTVDAVIAFGKASVNAFLEADKTASKLRNTIIAVNGESEQAFTKLLKQSAELQKISIFSDDSIQQAQAALAAFGLASEQIEEIIPRLADFATISNTDIVSAAQMVGAGLEGTGREFKKYGIEVSATADRLTNFNSILEGFTKFQGAAANAAGTFAGKIEQQRNAVDDLQEKIGEKLLPAFLKIQEFGLRAIKVIADLFGDDSKTAAQEAADTFGKLATEFNASIEVLKRGNITQEQRKALIEEINTQYAEYLPNLLTEKSSLKEIEEAQAGVNKQLEGRILLVALEEDIVRITKNSAAAAKDLIQIQKDRIKAEKNLSDNATLAAFTRDQLNQREAVANALIKTGRDELSGLQDQYAKLAAQLGINLSASNKLIEAQKGVNDQSDKRIAGSEKEIQKITALSSEYSALFDLLNSEDRQVLIDLSITAASDLQGQIDTLTKTLQASGIEVPVLFDENGNLLTFEKQVEVLKAELERNGIAIPVSIETTALDNFKQKVAQLKIDASKGVSVPLELSIPDNRKVDAKDFIQPVKEITDNAVNIFFQANQKIFDSSEELSNALQSLYAQITANRIAEIDKVKEAELSSLDAQQQAIDDNLAKRRISETDAEILSEQLEKKRLAAEKKALEESNRLKKKQFNIDKAAALVKIAINTAQGIASAYADFPYPVAVALSALIAATGAAEAGLVATQPNPYKKGTKKAKEGLARVGEEGEEIMWVPGGTKVLPHPKTVTYGQVLDKMMDGTFDKYYMRRDMAPRLTNQVKMYEKAQKERSDSNIANSMITASSGLTASEMDKLRRKGFPITNASEIVNGIAGLIKQDIYRR